MATSRTSEHLRYRYGICLNDNCQKCKNKEVQQIASRKDFLCEECGKPLRECPPPKAGPNKMLISIIIAAVVAIGAGIGIFLEFSGGDTLEPSPMDNVNAQSDCSLQLSDTVTIVKTDTVIEKEQMPVNEKTATKEKSQSTASVKSSGSVSLSYGKYSGSTQDGKPHGQGRMTFTSSHIIDSRDSKGRVAEAGDYVIGEWNNGNLVQGRWYGSDGNVKGSIIIGM